MVIVVPSFGIEFRSTVALCSIAACLTIDNRAVLKHCMNCFVNSGIKVIGLTQLFQHSSGKNISTKISI